MSGNDHSYTLLEQLPLLARLNEPLPKDCPVKIVSSALDRIDGPIAASSDRLGNASSPVRDETSPRVPKLRSRAAGTPRPPGSFRPSAILTTAFGTLAKPPAALGADDGEGHPGAGSRNSVFRDDGPDAGDGYPPVVVEQVLTQDMDRPAGVVQQLVLPGFAQLGGQEDFLQPVEDVHLQYRRVGPLAVGQWEQPVVNTRHQEVEGVGEPITDGLQLRLEPSCVARRSALLGVVQMVFTHVFSSVMISMGYGGQAVLQKRPELGSQSVLRDGLAMRAAGFTVPVGAHPVAGCVDFRGRHLLAMRDLAKSGPFATFPVGASRPPMWTLSAAGRPVAKAGPGAPGLFGPDDSTYGNAGAIYRQEEGDLDMILFDDTLKVPFEPGSGLSRSHFHTMIALGRQPFSSADDTAVAMSVDDSLVSRRLNMLETRGLVDFYRLGATKPRVQRWYLTPAGMRCLEVYDRLWNAEWGLARLLEVLPQVEWFYPISASLTDVLGPMIRFRWFRGVGWDAATRYQRGWVAFYWSSILQSEARIRETFSRLGTDLVEYNRIGSNPFPSLMCFVVSDAWQKELVMRVARSFDLQDHVQIWTVADGSVSGAREPRPGRGWVGQILEEGGLGGWSLENRVERSLWSKPGGTSIYKLLDGVYEWPGMDIPFGERFLHQAPDTGWVARHMAHLLKSGFLRRYKAGRSYSYVCHNPAFDLLSRRDRVNIQRPRKNRRHAQGPEERGLKTHERGLMDIMGSFYDAGLTVTNGARSWEHLGDAGIAPDGLVYLLSSPYGPGWHYLEYELRARSSKQAEDKIRGYASSRRGDRFPVLIGVRNDRMEQIFQAKGAESGIRMLTTTVERLSRLSPLDPGCWSMYGDAVSIDGRD